MKTYKHVKLGWKAENHISDIYNVSGDGHTYALPAELIENSSDWLEVKEPEFVITSFRDDEDKIWKLQSDGKYKYDGAYYSAPLFTFIEKDALTKNINRGNCEIYSVKYKDQEFKIGDKVKPEFHNSVYTIKKFQIEDGKMLVYMNEELKEYWTGDCINIEFLTHSPKVILTTEDGATITNEYETLFRAGKQHVHPEPAHYILKYKMHEDDKVFSTREAAETFISENKPKYSENDLREGWHNMSSCSIEDLITKLNKLT